MEIAPQNLRARSLPELLDAGASIYRDHFLHFLGVAAVAELPTALVTVLVATTLYSGQFPSYTNVFTEAGSVRPEVIAATVAGASLLGLLDLVLGSFGLAAMMYSIQARLGGQSPGVWQAYSAILGRMPALLATRFLVLLVIALTFVPAGVLFGVGAALASSGESSRSAVGVVLILAGLALSLAGTVLATFLWVRWRFHAQTSVLERKSPVSALRRSREIVEGRWWRTLGFVLLLQLFVVVLSATPGAVVGIPILIIYGPDAQTQFLPSLLSNSASTLAQILLLPVEVIALTLLYYDYRVRHEALDIETALARLNQEGASS